MNTTALHWAIHFEAPLDIVIQLAKLSSKKTINQKNDKGGWNGEWDGNTALDDAVELGYDSAAVYLSWLGAECKKENMIYKQVTRDTWWTFAKENGNTEDILRDMSYWAVAANDKKSMLKLVAIFKRKNSLQKLFSETLKNLAKVFNRQKICSLWAVFPSCIASPGRRSDTAPPP